jgi:ABC-2 type transport system ATP-binding protein
MRELIRDLSQNATVIVSTHILQEVQAVCERVLIMRAGQLVVDSRVDELGREGRLLVSVGEDASELIGAFGDIEHRAANDGIWHFRIRAAESVAPALAQTLVARGVPLHQLRAEKRDLESVFAEVNASDNRLKEVAHA